MGRIGEHPVGFLLPLPPDLFGPLEKLLVLFGDLLLGLAGEGHPPVLAVLIGLIFLEDQVSVLAEIEGATLEKLGIFCGRPVVVFISCHGSFLLFLVGQELTIHQQQELNFFQLIAERGLW